MYQCAVRVGKGLGNQYLADYLLHLVVVADGTKPTGGYSIDILTLRVKDKVLTVRRKLNCVA